MQINPTEISIMQKLQDRELVSLGSSFNWEKKEVRVLM
jgi:hypothetical protein